MVHRLATPPERRFPILAAIIVFHLGVIALLMQKAADVSPAVPATSIALIAVDAEKPAAAKPPPPAIPAKVAETFVPVTEISIPDDSQSDAPVGASAVCSTLEMVRSALLVDADALNVIRNAPPDTRSIAEAIVIWNVGWAPTALTPRDPLFSVKAAIERSLAGVPDNCLDEAVTGPRLIPIPDASGLRTIFVVIGSGNWTWRALLNASPPAGSEGIVPAPLPTPAASE